MSPPSPYFLTRRAFVSAAGLSAVLTILGGPRAVNQARAQAGAATELRVKAGSIRLRGAQHPATDIVGYGSVIPGPPLRARRDEEIRARLVNDWSEPTLIHWHGLRVPNGMDGSPYLTQPLVSPGQSFDYRFVARDAGTFWYHAPQASQFERGLSGPVIIDETEPVDVDRDVLLMLDDWHLNGDGSLQNGTSSPQSGLPTLTANGLSNLAISVRRGERIRLRLINATVGRLLPVSIPGQTAWVMAIDGQPAEPFVARDSSVIIAPGNRLDLFVDITDGASGAVPITVEVGAGQTAQVARLTVEDGPARKPSRDAPRPLPQNPLPVRVDLRSALRAQLSVDADVALAPIKDTVGGKKISKGQTPTSTAPISWVALDQLSQATGRPLFTTKRDRAVTLGLGNTGPHAYVLHVHGHAFRLLDNLDDGWKPFWLDTLLVAPQQTARIAFVADAPGRWAIERRSLAEPRRESLVWFEVD